jgi:hypothetical protein
VKRLYRVCGSCSTSLIRAGGEAKHANISLGTPCERHPSMQATIVIEADDGLLPAAAPSVERDDDEEATDEDAVSSVDGVAIPSSVGPLTEIAARLVASWGHKSEGAKSDVFMVRHAVNVARRLLEETGGR